MDKMFTETEAAPEVRLAASTLQKLRVTGGGPPYVKLGRAVRYRESDLRDWVEARLTRSTSDRVAA